MQTNNIMLKCLIRNLNLRNKGIIEDKEDYAEKLAERINPPRIVINLGDEKQFNDQERQRREQIKFLEDFGE